MSDGENKMCENVLVYSIINTQVFVTDMIYALPQLYGKHTGEKY